MDHNCIKINSMSTVRQNVFVQDNCATFSTDAFMLLKSGGDKRGH